MRILWTLISAVNPEALEKSVLIYLLLWLSFSLFNDCRAYLQADVILSDFRCSTQIWPTVQIYFLKGCDFFPFYKTQCFSI